MRRVKASLFLLTRMVEFIVQEAIDKLSKFRLNLPKFLFFKSYWVLYVDFILFKAILKIHQFPPCFFE